MHPKHHPIPNSPVNNRIPLCTNNTVRVYCCIVSQQLSWLLLQSSSTNSWGAVQWDDAELRNPTAQPVPQLAVFGGGGRAMFGFGIDTKATATATATATQQQQQQQEQEYQRVVTLVPNTPQQNVFSYITDRLWSSKPPTFGSAE